jgi:hypothetical protein
MKSRQRTASLAPVDSGYRLVATNEISAIGGEPGRSTGEVSASSNPPPTQPPWTDTADGFAQFAAHLEADPIAARTDETEERGQFCCGGGGHHFLAWFV